MLLLVFLQYINIYLTVVVMPTELSLEKTKSVAGSEVSRLKSAAMNLTEPDERGRNLSWARANGCETDQMCLSKKA